ncbi:MAG: response regulator, partial [Bacteroidota bacterium]
MENLKIIDILLVEDSEGDARLATEALKESKVKNKLFIVSDGVAATDFLFKRNEYKDVPSPDLILLDLNLPKKDGRQVLAEIKEDENLKRIPVVVLTISSAEQDILKAYNLHANCFITKPLDLYKFME